MNKNLWLLILSQIFAFTAAPVTVFLSGIIGSQFSPIKSLATLPMALSIVGIAIFAFFAAKIMSIIGRRAGFILASVGSSLASLMASYSIIIESFLLFNLGCFLLGAGVAFSHQYRFAAVETVDKDMAPKAISIILLAGIGSAFIGPNLANISKEIILDHLYAGSYVALAILTLSSTIFLLFYEDNHRPNNLIKKNTRSYFELITQPRFLQALIASSFAYAVMSFLMTATPISMHVMEKISLAKTGLVIQLHIAAMFLPSLITGNLIKKFGHSKIMYLGVLLFLITILTSLFEQNFKNYLIALIFLGFGWNFLFISGTSLLVLSYKEEEKFKAQGFNDLIVYTVQAIASLSAGIFISLTSWKTMNLVCIIFLIIIVISTFRADLKQRI
ncbi:transporter, major facilitator family [Candidatus Pelagibacter sp. HTCC7211]|uniref:MFS transporter n=1 Tax=Pelagibacter sp. (strain HTCC7211) TaxID=439493 RepID=UPI0001838CEA|nr:MFS transporter [Candidatus Pelagibacter sp. HTCC7211]EDZ60174.1 transporter, major facilitator family [Candidatus Pelagibacter sp. HTCC7211]MBD1151336.1 MFS transporter [Pelagibacterales bacterium SAG-MED25]